MIFLRSLALAAFVLALVCGSAVAAPVTVNLRVEGATQTIYEGPITTDAKLLRKDPSDPGSDQVACDGTSDGGPPGPTMLTALDDASLASGFEWVANWFGDDPFVDRIGPDSNDFSDPDNMMFWSLLKNEQLDQTMHGCQQRVQAGDRALFAYNRMNQQYLVLSAPVQANTGQPIVVEVREHDIDGNFMQAANANVMGQTTAANGRATVSFPTPGVKRFKATRADAIRSNAVEVCVEEPGSGTCTGFQSRVGVNLPLPPRAVDATRPRVRTFGLRNGGRFERGLQLLRGFANSLDGIRDVRLRLYWIGEGRCRFFAGELERFSGPRGCRGDTFWSVGDSASWSYLLPHRLRPGKYLLTVKVVDRFGKSRVLRVRFRVV